MGNESDFALHLFQFNAFYCRIQNHGQATTHQGIWRFYLTLFHVPRHAGVTLTFMICSLVIVPLCVLTVSLQQSLHQSCHHGLLVDARRLDGCFGM